MNVDGEGLHHGLWRELERAVEERDHPWRTPVLATVDRAGMPQARTIVLRAADRGRQELRLFTDGRSPKADQLGDGNGAVLVLWNPERRWQLRIACRGTVLQEGPEVEAAWRRIQDTEAATDYLAPAAPGSPLRNLAVQGDGSHNLAVVVLSVATMDWLELGTSGHRRALVAGSEVTWLVP